MTMPIIQSGTFTLGAGTTSVAVTFATAYSSGVTPRVLAGIQENRNYNSEWVHTISETGFTYQIETADADYARNIAYIAISA